MPGVSVLAGNKWLLSPFFAREAVPWHRGVLFGYTRATATRGFVPREFRNDKEAA